MLNPRPRGAGRVETEMAETLSTRVTRLEEAMIRLANAQAHLAEVQAQDQSEAREREKRIDERIEKLVVAIAELIRKNGHGD